MQPDLPPAAFLANPPPPEQHRPAFSTQPPIRNDPESLFISTSKHVDRAYVTIGRDVSTNLIIIISFSGHCRVFSGRFRVCSGCSASRVLSCI